MENRARNTLPEFLATAIELAIVALSIAYVVSNSLPVLLIWEIVAISYLLVGCFLVRRRANDSRRDPSPGRVGVLDTLSWILPVAASLTGANAAVAVLTQKSTDVLRDHTAAAAVVGSLGIIISWHLLHSGFAQIYESIDDVRQPSTKGLEFPGEAEPSLADYLYFSFTVGTSFATSDVTVLTTRMRWLVLGHSIASFLYNALVVAVAFQILQRLASV